LAVRVQREHQLDKMVAWLAKKGYDFELTHPMGERTQDALLVIRCPWAANLTYIAERLERYDMEMP
jgi:hypothetical protein